MGGEDGVVRNFAKLVYESLIDSTDPGCGGHLFFFPLSLCLHGKIEVMHALVSDDDGERERERLRDDQRPVA